MEKIQSLCFYRTIMKHITLEMKNNRWIITSHGKMPLVEGRISNQNIQWANKQHGVFKNKRFNKNKGYITVEGHHTYLNHKSINTLEKLKHPDIIQLNFKNTLPILFEKDRYGISYNVEYIDNIKTTEISFMGMLHEKIDCIYQSCLNLNVDPLMLNPTYQYFANILKKQLNFEEKKEYVLYVESSANLLTFVLIHNNNPIMKRSIEINDQLEIETNNYFYYLKHYLMLPDIFIFFSKMDQKMELFVIIVSGYYYNNSSQKIQELLRDLSCFREMDQEVMIEFQDCFIALGGVVIDESIKRKNQS